MEDTNPSLSAVTDKRNARSWIANCSRIAALLMVIALGGICFWLARANIFHIPYISPTVDIPLDSSAANLPSIAQVQQKVSNFVVHAPTNEQEVRTITLTNADATSLLRGLAAQAQDHIAVQGLAATFHAGEVRINGVITKPIVSPMVLVLKPILTDHVLTLTIASLELGATTLPAPIIDFVAMHTITPLVAKLNAELNMRGALDTLEMSEGMLRATGVFRATQ